MPITSNQRNARNHTSTLSMAISFIAINCIIVSVLTFALAALAVVTNNYDKWFPVAIALSVSLFFLGRVLLSSKMRQRIDARCLKR